LPLPLASHARTTTTLAATSPDSHTVWIGPVVP
jgi:hypothetical protein